MLKRPWISVTTYICLKNGDFAFRIRDNGAMMTSSILDNPETAAKKNRHTLSDQNVVSCWKNINYLQYMQKTVFDHTNFELVLTTQTWFGTGNLSNFRFETGQLKSRQVSWRKNFGTGHIWKRSWLNWGQVKYWTVSGSIPDKLWCPVFDKNLSSFE